VAERMTPERLHALETWGKNYGAPLQCDDLVQNLVDEVRASWADAAEWRKHHDDACDRDRAAYESGIEYGREECARIADKWMGPVPRAIAYSIRALNATPPEAVSTPAVDPPDRPAAPTAGEKAGEEAVLVHEETSSSARRLDSAAQLARVSVVAAVAAEREACARVADRGCEEADVRSKEVAHGRQFFEERALMAARIADDIRARGDKDSSVDRSALVADVSDKWRQAYDAACQRADAAYESGRLYARESCARILESAWGLPAAAAAIRALNEDLAQEPAASVCQEAGPTASAGEVEAQCAESCAAPASAISPAAEDLLAIGAVLDLAEDRYICLACGYRDPRCPSCTEWAANVKRVHRIVDSPASADPPVAVCLEDDLGWQRAGRLEEAMRATIAHLRHYGDIGASAARELLEEALA